MKSLLEKLFCSRRNLIELTQDQKTDLLGFSMQCMSVCDNWCRRCQKRVPWGAGVLDNPSPVHGFVRILVLLERDSVLLILSHWLRAWAYPSLTPAFTAGDFTGVNWFITYFQYHSWYSTQPIDYMCSLQKEHVLNVQNFYSSKLLQVRTHLTAACECPRLYSFQ